MILFDNTKPTSCLNWQLIARDKFPAEYNDSNVREDFELLFQEQLDPVKLKETLRQTQRQPNQAVRKFLWKRIILLTSGVKSSSSASNGAKQQQNRSFQSNIEGYNKKIAVLFGKNLKLRAEIPSFVDQGHLTFYYLNEDGKAAVYRVLNVLASQHPDITFAPLLLPLASLFLHYMQEAECYASLVAICESGRSEESSASSNYRLMTQTDLHWLTTNHVFRRFAQKYAPTAYEFLIESVYRETNEPDICFDVVDEWQWWIFECLPFNYILNIVDSFLLEGQKVLLRCGLALLNLFYKSFAHPRPNALPPTCMRDFCSSISAPYDRLIKLAYGYRGIRRRDVDSVFQAEEKLIKKLRANAAATNSSVDINDVDSVAVLAENQYNESKRNQLRRLSTQSFINTNNIASGGSSTYKKFYSKMVGPFRRASAVKKEAKIDENLSNQIFDSYEIIEADISTAPKSEVPAIQINGGHVEPETNAIMQLNSSFNSIASNKSNKKWYRNGANGSCQSFYHYHHHHHHQLNTNLPGFSIENIGSAILTPEQIACLWRWLPSRLQVLEIQLIYSTNIHGCRLMTLFDKIEFYPSSLIIVQTTSRAIFGAFCSQPWSNRLPTGRARKPSFFGNGETFLFELLPRICKYEWIGKQLHGDTTPGQEMFQYADMDKLIVGGSGGSSGGMGFVIDSDLAYGRTAECETFRNGLLGGERDFEIVALEVLSFEASSCQND